MSGGWTALGTPMRSNGRVDWRGFAKNIEFQVANGITGILPVGTTGESPTLSWKEHNRVIESAVKTADGRCKVLAGTGSNSTAEAVAATEHAAHAGADAALLVECYYNGPSSLELRREYHAAVANAMPDLALVPYIIPGRTGCAMTPEDLAILAAEHANVIAVKEATGDLDRMARTRQLCGSGFSIMSGDDDLTYEMMTRTDIRANGVVSVISNVVPKAVEQMTRAILAGDIGTADRLRDALNPLFQLVTVKARSSRTLPSGETVEVEDKFRNPLGLKVLMNGLGMPSGPARPPLGKMTPEGVAIVRETARQVWQDNPEILEPVAEFYKKNITRRLNTDRYWQTLCYGV